MDKGNKTDVKSQEIGFKNYNPFLISLNTLQDDLIVLGNQMYDNPLLMEKYFIVLRNMYSKYSSYIFKKKEVLEKLDSLKRYLESSQFIEIKREYHRTETILNLSANERKNLNICREKLLKTFEEINEQFGINGLIPKPERKDEELWETEKIKSMRLRKKAVLQIIFGDI